jgi:hypothetical protein
MQPQDAILHGKLRSSFNFDILVDVFRSFADLPQDAVVVDLEGGVRCLWQRSIHTFESLSKTRRRLSLRYKRYGRLLIISHTTLIAS